MDFSHIALLLVVAAGAGFVAKLFKQPLLIGYLFAGVILGVTGILGDQESFQSLGQIGVALLLFLVGLEMNIGEIPSIGKVALLTGLGQIIFTSVVGYLIAISLGFAPLVAVYIAIALTFSSTIIIIKLLSEKNELGTLHGKISLGFLLVQDLVAIVILMVLAGIGEGSTNAFTYFEVLGKAIILLGVLFLLSKYVLHRVFSKFIDSSGELVFIVSIAWALGLAAFVGGPLGLSLEIGGFLAGISLSSMPEHLQIAAKTRPLRDFFLTIFFLVLGTNLIVGDIGHLLVPALIFSAFVLIGNPIIVMIIMGLLGYRKRTSLSASLTVAQISEFSLILMAMGVTLGHVSQEDVALVVLVGVITMTVSTYMILNTDIIYKYLKGVLSVFERKHTVDENKFNKNQELTGHIVMIGADRTGRSLIPLLDKKYKLVVVDYNPRVVEDLAEKNVNVVFGDINDQEIMDAVNLNASNLIISTTGRLDDNLLLLSSVSRLKRKPKVIVKAHTRMEALKMYKKGATYVIVPEVIAGEHIRHLIKTYGASERLKKQGRGHRKRLNLAFS